MKPECAITCTPDVFPGLDEARKRRRQPPQNLLPGSSVVDELEARRLMSAAIVGGVLVVGGTSGADSIVVYQVNAVPNTFIYVDDNGTIRGGFADTVSYVQISGMDGDDTLSIQLFSSGGRDPLTKNTKMWGGNGADVLSGGNQVDTLQGDAGNDTLYGYDGNDILYGGYGGTDELHGGENNDLMYGGDAGNAGNVEAESDTLYGENGNDTLYGEGGNDLLDPGNNADFAYGGDGNDTFSGSNDNFFDWLDGGAGTDSAGAGTYDSPGDSLFNFP